MKRYIKLIFLTIATSLVLLSCTKDAELLFDQADMIYVDTNPDSTEYTFATSAADKIIDSIMINYRIIGKSAPVDRTFSLAPSATSKGTLGYHYKIGKSVIKANQFNASVPIYVYRKAGLKDSTLRIVLQIVPNENFKVGFPDKQLYKFTLSDILSKPSNWESTWANYFGSYSEVKFKFLISATGKTNWNSSPLPQDSRYLSQRARIALLEYNQQYGALIDEFGQQVFFP